MQQTKGSIIRGILVFLGLVFVVLIGVGVYVYRTFLRAPIVVGQVMVQSGEVLVNGQSIHSTKRLEQGDQIETKNGQATVYLYESIIVTLSQQTKIVLTDMNGTEPHVGQLSGKTWNQFTGLGGLRGYSITEHGRIATVHGTAFELATGKIATAEGVVTYEAEGKVFSVTQGKVVEDIGTRVNERAMTPNEQSSANAHLADTVVALRFLRDQEIAKYPILLNKVKEQFHITDEQIRAGLLAADNGQVNVDELSQKVPFHIPAVDRIIALTKAIQKLPH